jgi:hypothetical protein
MMTEIAKHQAPMQEKIDQLPTWEEWKEDIQPEVHKAMNSHARAVDNLKSDLCRDILYWLDGQKTTLTNPLDSKLRNFASRFKRGTTRRKSASGSCWGLRGNRSGSAAAVLGDALALENLLVDNQPKEQEQPQPVIERKTGRGKNKKGEEGQKEFAEWKAKQAQKKRRRRPQQANPRRKAHGGDFPRLHHHI